MTFLRFPIAALIITMITCFAAPSADAAVTPGRLEFVIERGGREEGRHIVEVRSTATGWTVQSTVSIDVKFGPVTVFTYRHNCAETWDANRLSTLNCETTKGDKASDVQASRSGDALIVNGVRLAGDASPTTWWARAVLGGSAFIDTETGELRDLVITQLGASNVTTGSGAIAARKVRVAGPVIADLWYDAAGRWVGCTFTARGQTFTYRLISPLAEAPIRA